MTNRMLRCDDGWNVLAQRPDLDEAIFCGTAFTLGNGYLGTRGTCPELGKTGCGRPATFIAGVYVKPRAKHKPTRLVVAPDWLPFRLSDGDGELSAGDGVISDYMLAMNLRTGTFTRSLRWTGPKGRITRVEITRLVSLDAPHLCGERFSITPENYSGAITFTNILDAGARPFDGEEQHSVVWNEQLDLGTASALALAVRTRKSEMEIASVSALRAPASTPELADHRGNASWARYRCNVSEGVTFNLDRIVAYACTRDGAQAHGSPLQRATQAVREAPDWAALLAKQRESWARFWQQSGVEVEGDPETQWMLRFTLFHLWQCACDNTMHTDASIGARGIHGEGYSGHIFWDTETYMLPFFISTQPEVARALLMYRYRRLPAARRRARLEGIEGARFPWESADSGEETTPTRSGPDQNGEHVRIHTGEQEIHITADVAQAVWSYCDSSGDQEFYLQYGAEMILDTARFWVGRLERRTGIDGDVRYEISGIIGPDEYHEQINNNLYTNAMAHWNVQRAVAVGRDLAQNHPEVWDRLSRKLQVTSESLSDWESIASKIVIPFDEERQLYSQFDNYFDLEDGVDRCAYRDHWRCAVAERVQIVKQADVLLALELMPELCDVTSFGRHFDYYEPRTTHESSTSPAMHALFAARVGRPALGFDYLKKALALDCQNTGGAESGIHAANLGGLWQAVVMGFGGIATAGDHIVVNPCLPRHWTALSFSILWRSRQLRFQITHQEVMVALEKGDQPVPIRIDGRTATVVPGQAHLFPRRVAAQKQAAEA